MPPEDGKANTAVIKLLAKTWRLSSSSFTLVQGQTSRTKVLDVAGDTGDLCTRLVAWLQHGP